eukprot:5818445-Lingulodinium_polyedra.AAC.1
MAAAALYGHAADQAAASRALQPPRRGPRQDLAPVRNRAQPEAARQSCRSAVSPARFAVARSAPATPRCRLIGAKSPLAPG